MSLLGFIGQAPRPPEAIGKVLAEPQIGFEEALVCGRRMWIRGQLVDPGFARDAKDASRPARWSGWPRRPQLALPNRTIQIQMRIGTQSFENELP